MAKKYQVNNIVRFANRIVVHLIYWNIAPPGIYVLIVPGLKTGNPYSMPVRPVAWEGKHWLVAPYGEVSWVKNARVSGEVSLFREGKTQTFKIHEVRPHEAAPVLKVYVTRESMVRPYFDAQPDSPLEAFETEASKHPAFLLDPRGELV